MHKESYESVEITITDVTGESTTYFIPKAQGFRISCEQENHYDDISSFNVMATVRPHTSYSISVPEFYPLMDENGSCMKVYRNSGPSASTVWNANRDKEHYDHRRNVIREIWPELGDALDRLPKGDVK